MTLLWIIAALIALAAGTEAWMKRDQYRPLSQLASNRRRYDDPNAPKNTQGNYELDAATYNTCCQAFSGKSWTVAADPEGYARAMMPRTVTRTDKGQSK